MGRVGYATIPYRTRYERKFRVNRSPGGVGRTRFSDPNDYARRNNTTTRPSGRYFTYDICALFSLYVTAVNSKFGCFIVRVFSLVESRVWSAFQIRFATFRNDV